MRSSKWSRFVSSFAGAALFLGVLGGALTSFATNPAQSAGAATSSIHSNVSIQRTEKFHCVITADSVIPTESLATTLTLSFHGTFPTGVDPTHTASITNFQITVIVAAKDAVLLYGIGGTHISAKVTKAAFSATNVTNPTFTLAPITVPTFNVTKNNPIKLSTPVPPATLHLNAKSSGTITLSPGPIKMMATLPVYATLTSTKPKSTKTVPITCTPLAGAPSIGSLLIATPVVTKTLLAATAGLHYTGQLQGLYGTEPYKWSISGALPPGLTLNPSTGKISGVASVTGSYKLKATLVDKNTKTATATVTLTVLSAGAPGYVFANQNGTVTALGGDKSFGEQKHPKGHIAGIALAPSEEGYWEVTTGGTVYGYGSAKGHGSERKPSSAISSIVGTPTGAGYWLVDTKGAIYPFGKAAKLKLKGKPKKPISGAAGTPTGKGLWLVATNGTVYAIGTAKNHGSVKKPSSPVTGIATNPTGKGYWIVDSKGKVYGFGGVKTFASKRPNSPAIAVSSSPTGKGYWVADSKGKVYGYGTAKLKNAAKAAKTHYTGFAASAYRPPVPKTTSISPNAGASTGGTTVVISGSSFTTSVTKKSVVKSVSFGGYGASSYKVTSSTKITAKTPLHSAGFVTVAVKTLGGSVRTSTTGYHYVYEGATISSISPNSGPPNGGTTIVITGSDFDTPANGQQEVLTVEFGDGSTDVAATTLTIVSGTELKMKTPEHVFGETTVKVTTYGTTGKTFPTKTRSTTKSNGFDYVDPIPTVTKVAFAAPTTTDNGATTGGTRVDVTGSGFFQYAGPTTNKTLKTGASVVLAVTFGSESGITVTVVSTTTLVVSSPPHAPGNVTISVTNDTRKTGSLATGFTYTHAESPRITGVTPGSGLETGGYTVQVTGGLFITAGTGMPIVKSVTFGGVTATTITVTSTHVLTVKAPFFTTGTTHTELVLVVVTTTGGVTTQTVKFTYVK